MAASDRFTQAEEKYFRLKGNSPPVAARVSNLTPR
jgi:hypothetical protein